MKFFGLTFVALLSATSFAELVTITNTKDNTLFEDLSGSFSAGAGIHFYVGNTAGSDARRGLIYFDVTNSIPVGSVITSTSLRLVCNRSAPTSGSQSVRLHRLTSNWGEGNSSPGGAGGSGAPSGTGDATWVHTFFDTNFWLNLGGDFVSETSSVQNVAGATAAYTWSTGLTTDVQLWLNDPSTNFGWIVIGNEAASKTAKRFASRENSSAISRPTLTIGYLAPAILTNSLLTIDSSALSNEWQAVSGAIYQVQYSTNLLDDAAWLNFGDAITAQNTTASFVDTNLIEAIQTYRIIRQ